MTDGDALKKTVHLFHLANLSPATRPLNVPDGTEIIYWSSNEKGMFHSVMMVNRALWERYPFLVHEGDATMQTRETAVFTVSKKDGDYTRWTAWRAPREDELLSSREIIRSNIKGSIFAPGRAGFNNVSGMLAAFTRSIREGTSYQRSVGPDGKTPRDLLCQGQPDWRWAAWECLVCHRTVSVKHEMRLIDPCTLMPWGNDESMKCPLNIGTCTWELTYGPNLER